MQETILLCLVYHGDRNAVFDAVSGVEELQFGKDFCPILRDQPAQAD